MVRRAPILTVILAAGVFALFSVRAASQESTPAASPGAGTAVAQEASPEASPVGTPMAGDVDPAAAERGRTAAAICLACHSVDGSQMVGPTWQGLYLHEVTLDDGSTVIADEAYLRESILDPMAKIVEGYPPSMPPFEGMLTEEQISDIIEYIKSLR